MTVTVTVRPLRPVAVAVNLKVQVKALESFGPKSRRMAPQRRTSTADFTNKGSEKEGILLPENNFEN